MRKVHYTLHREDDDFVAQCLDYDISSFGHTEQEALANLKEAIELYLEDTDEPTPRITEVSVGEFAVSCASDAQAPLLLRFHQHPRLRRLTLHLQTRQPRQIPRRPRPHRHRPPSPKGHPPSAPSDR